MSLETGRLGRSGGKYHSNGSDQLWSGHYPNISTLHRAELSEKSPHAQAPERSVATDDLRTILGWNGNLCRGGFHMLSGLPDAISHHIGRDASVRDDLEEAYAGLTATVRLVVHFQDASSHPEALEDLGSFRIGPVENLGVSTHLDSRWREKP